MSNKVLHTWLIDRLAGDLAPRQRPWPPVLRAALWCGVSFLTTYIGVEWFGTYRIGFADELLHNRQFLAEVVAGVFAALVAAYVAFDLSVPGRRWHRYGVLIGSAPFLVFTLLSLFGFFSPAITPSWDGWRLGCEREIVVIAVLPALCAFALARSAVPTTRKGVAWLIAIAATCPVATAMHLACMYDPLHTIVFHILPVILCAGVASFFGERILE